MNCNDHHHNEKYTRRDFLTRTSLGLGALTLGSLINPAPVFGSFSNSINQSPKLPHFPAKAKRIIYLFQSGAPSQLDLFDHKPLLKKLNGQELPESIRGGQRLTGMTAGQASFPLVSSIFNFKQHGESGAWMSDLMPHTSKIVDELCFIKSMYTEEINHDPAVTFIQSGSNLPGRPSMGSWISYGLGSDNKNLPEFVVLVTKDKQGQPLYARSWGNGFLPSKYQGVQFRSGKDAVLYLENPPGVTGDIRKEQIDYLKKLENENYEGLYNERSFTVEAEKAHILKENPNIVFMKKMHVTMYLKDGRIVNITSCAGLENMGPVTYGVSKAALTAYTRTMGRILATETKNVVMTAIFPGVVLTKGGHWDKVIKKNPSRAKKYLKESINKSS